MGHWDLLGYRNDGAHIAPGKLLGWQEEMPRHYARTWCDGQEYPGSVLVVFADCNFLDL